MTAEHSIAKPRYQWTWTHPDGRSSRTGNPRIAAQYKRMAAQLGGTVTRSPIAPPSYLDTLAREASRFMREEAAR